MTAVRKTALASCMAVRVSIYHRMGMAVSYYAITATCVIQALVTQTDFYKITGVCCFHDRSPDVEGERGWAEGDRRD